MVRVEFAEDALRGLDLIFVHLAESYRGFGEAPDEASERAAARVRGILAAADRSPSRRTGARSTTISPPASGTSPSIVPSAVSGSTETGCAFSRSSSAARITSAACGSGSCVATDDRRAEFSS